MKIREARESDQSFVLDSFCREYLSTPYAQGASFGTIRGLMFDLLASPKWQCLVGCDDENEDEIYGYVVYRVHSDDHTPQSVAWLHVKNIYRRQGFGAQLLTASVPAWSAPIHCPFLSPRVLKLALRFNLTLRFRPYLVFDR